MKYHCDPSKMEGEEAAMEIPHLECEQSAMFSSIIGP